MKKLVHIDLFSGIGGAAFAIDSVWGRENVEHIFCDNDKFCQQVLKKHYPESEIFGDIRTFAADAIGERHIHGKPEIKPAEPELQAQRESSASIHTPFILTGGFPCQPFSQAGRRKGTEDDRYLWPEMLRVIREFHPRWIIAENVAGFVTWNGGMVLRQVLTDLETAGYQVQPFIIPACAVNAPHRRDRIWIVANRTSERPDSGECGREERYILRNKNGNAPQSEPKRQRWERRTSSIDNTSQNSLGKRGRRRSEDGRQVLERKSTETKIERPSGESDTSNSKRQRHEGKVNQEGQSSRYCGRTQWDKHWFEVATELCGVDDGLPAKLDGFELSKAGHRRERLKGLGNAWVPQVAIQIMNAIKEIDT